MRIYVLSRSTPLRTPAILPSSLDEKVSCVVRHDKQGTNNHGYISVQNTQKKRWRETKQTSFSNDMSGIAAHGLASYLEPPIVKIEHSKIRLQEKSTVAKATSYQRPSWDEKETANEGFQRFAGFPNFSSNNPGKSVGGRKNGCCDFVVDEHGQEYRRKVALEETLEKEQRHSSLVLREKTLVVNEISHFVAGSRQERCC